MARRKLKPSDRTVKLDMRIEESTRDLLVLQAKRRGMKNNSPSMLGREYIRIMALAEEAASSPAMARPSVEMEVGAGEDVSARKNTKRGGGAMLAEICQPREIVQTADAIESILLLAEPWSLSGKIVPVRAEVLRRASRALECIRDMGEREPSPEVEALRASVLSHKGPLLLCFGAMAALTVPGQTRQGVQETLQEAEYVLSGLVDAVLGAGEGMP